MKSKKFDAHEKHFKKKEMKLLKEMKKNNEECMQECMQLNHRNIELAITNEKLKKENIELKEKYDKLLQYSKLSDEEIKKALKSDTSLNQIATILDSIPRFY